MKVERKIRIEVMYKADHCLPCFYMDEAVKQILPDYSDFITYERVEISTAPGRDRFIELSISLFGREGVFKHHRIAPIPSLFINGELFFDAIPPKYMLEEAIQEVSDGATVCSTPMT